MSKAPQRKNESKQSVGSDPTTMKGFAREGEVETFYDNSPSVSFFSSGGVSENMIQTDRLLSLGVLSASIIDEIRNPLTSINCFADALLSESGYVRTEEEKQLLFELKKAAGVIAEMVKRVLNYAAPKTFSWKLLDLNSLVENCVLLWTPTLRKSGVSVMLDREEGPLYVEGDEMSLQHVINNLILSGMEAMWKCGVLSVSTRKEKDAAIIRVCDSGPGTGTDRVGGVLEPFFSARPDGPGRRVMVCISIVEKHGGALSVDRLSDHGAVVTIFLPTAQAV